MMPAATPTRPAGPATETPAGSSRRRPGREHVTLVHGFLANSLMLTLLGSRLRRHGYRTRAWGYWNMRSSILVHARKFERTLRALDEDPEVDTIHVVTHSMGGIIARAALADYRPRKIGRFVMLAPPNRGSFVANAMAPPLGWLLRPIAELTTAGDSLVNSLQMPRGIEIGVIAAEWDALVDEASTHLDVPHAHASLPCLHSGLLFRREAAALVAAFLRSGCFPGAQQQGRPAADEAAIDA